MYHMEYVTKKDKDFWDSLDNELPTSEFFLKVRDKRGFVIFDVDFPIGILRYNLMWDIHPFLTLIILKEEYYGMGFGRKAVLEWEGKMREMGFGLVMTSTMVNESAQHFYRKMGYIDRGTIFLDNTSISQPQEMIMIKQL